MLANVTTAHAPLASSSKGTSAARGPLVPLARGLVRILIGRSVYFCNLVTVWLVQLVTL